jgi:chemotaxis protein methyltransferase CheR
MDATGFATISSFLKTNSGLILTQDKGYLLESRLQPVAAQHGLKNVEDLIAKLRIAPPEVLKRDIVEAMTTNETSFFRDVKPFDLFREYVLAELIERRKTTRTIRVLCAAASSGQEPYSLAMLVAEAAARLVGWNVEIIGIDIDTKILQRAEEGLYTQFEVQRGLPIQMLMKYFDQLPGQNWKVKPKIRSMVKYKFCNLLQPFTELGRFDVIFCRNVLIYFDVMTKKNVLERLHNQMSPDGYLFLGGAETVLDITDRFMPLAGRRGIYVQQPPKVRRLAVG